MNGPKTPKLPAEVRPSVLDKTRATRLRERNEAIQRLERLRVAVRAAKAKDRATIDLQYALSALQDGDL